MSFSLRYQRADEDAKTLRVDADDFWIGAGQGAWELALEIPKLFGELVHVRKGVAGVEARAEPELPLPLSTSAGSLGTRYEPLLDHEVLLIGKYRVEIRWEVAEPELRKLDEAALAEDGDSQEALADWFESFMALADRLDGVRGIEELVRVSLEAVLATTQAERAHVALDLETGEIREWFLAKGASTEAFGVSRSLIERVRSEDGVVFVPESATDPLVAGLVSVRRHGISASLAVPLRALGRHIGVLYADCVSVDRTLKKSDFQKAALLGRMLAGAIGSRRLVETFLEADASVDLPMGLRSRSPACRDMIEKARLFASTDYTILIRGETGVGKDVLARSLHEISGRSGGQFVPVNCAAIPAQLMESELFGHVKGSFTGASADKDGFFVAAHGGTLFLDEIGDMELELQAKILRAIETRVVTPVGGTKQIPVDVRILAATHQDLEQMVQDGSFREDLYFRIKELEIRVPPLRERVEDILVLAEGFLREAEAELPGNARATLAPEASRMLMDHSWRGNIRELRHALRTAALRAAGGEIRPEHLELMPERPGAAKASPPAEEPEDDGLSWKERLEAQEREALKATLERAGGNLTKAAMMFGLPRTTYRERLLKYGLL